MNYKKFILKNMNKMETRLIGDKSKPAAFDCVIAVDERGGAFLIRSLPSLYEHDLFEGNCIQDNVNKCTENIPKEMGIYRCFILVDCYSYYTDCGNEYDVDIWIEDCVKVRTDF